MKSLSEQVVATGGPSYSGTLAEPVSLHDDKASYTGVCAKYLFDKKDQKNLNYGRVKKVENIEILFDGGDHEEAKAGVPYVSKRPAARPSTSQDIATQNKIVSARVDQK